MTSSDQDSQFLKISDQFGLVGPHTASQTTTVKVPQVKYYQKHWYLGFNSDPEKFFTAPRGVLPFKSFVKNEIVHRKMFGLIDMYLVLLIL